MDPYGSISISLTINGVAFTDSTSASINGNHVFLVKNSVLNFKDLSLHDLNLGGSLIYSQNASGSFENILMKNVQMSSAPTLQLLDPVWSFTNVTFDAVETSPSSNGIIYLASTLFSSARNNQVTFGGNISFLNVPTETVWNADAAAISITHTTAATPMLIGSSASKPSQFVMRNSDVNLFASRGKVNSPLVVNITIGSSVEVVATPTATFKRAVFNLESQDILNRYGVTNVHVQGSIYAQGISILARGAGASSTPLASSTLQFRVDGEIVHAADGSALAPFALTWPADIFADGIASSLLGRSSDALTTQFVAYKSGVFTSSASPAISSFTVAKELSISSMPINASTVSQTSTSLIPLTLANIGLKIVAGAFSINNASASQSATAYSNTRLATAISVSNGGSLSITTTSGNISFVGNQNLFGAGGAIYIDGTSASKLTLNSNAEIIFSNNTAYYGGALYQLSGSTLQLTANAIYFESNVATYAGGVAYIPKANLTTLLPENITTYDDNGAFEFGCIFAFADTSSASDVSNTSCPTLYNASTTNGNHRLGESYLVAETCLEFERLCDPILEPFEPVTPPFTAPIDGPSFEPSLVNATDPTSAPSLKPSTNPVEASSPSDTTSPIGINTPTSENSTDPVSLAEPAESAVCVNGSFIPPQAFCNNGSWQISAADAVAYFSSSSKRSTSESNAICDVPLEIIDGNATIPTVTLRNVLLSKSTVPILYSSECLIVEEVVVDLSAEELKKLISAKRAPSVSLVKSSCPSTATTVKVVGAQPVYGCQRIKMGGYASNTKFSIEDSRCNIWWIVLLSILGAIFLAAAIIAIVYTQVCAKRRPQPRYIQS